MLNKSGERELCYIVKIDNIFPLEGYDRVESAAVGGWRIIVRKGQFKPGDHAIYFEIDSKVPEEEPFMFLEKRHFKVKTQRMCKSISQGLLLGAEDFGWQVGSDCFIDKEGHIYNFEDESRFLTKRLNVTYATEEDNKRKGASYDKYKKMAQRRPNIFKQPWARWMMRREWGRKVMFVFFGKKKDKKGGWPSWVQKTDEERAQNLTWRFKEGNTQEWVVSEKIDGTSTTATYRKRGRKKHEFYICSRNVVFDKPDKDLFYETNVYTEMAEKYKFEEVLGKIVDEYKLEWATLQGETYGGNIQKRGYGMNGHDFAGFNLIFSDRGRLNSYEAKEIMDKYEIPWVPLICDNYILPATVEEVLEYAKGESKIDGGMREGVVFRSKDGVESFKAVSNEYLMKYHS